METSQKLKFGSTFKAESQQVHVNCKAERVQDDAWKAGVFTINFGQSWYYSPLKHTSRPENPVTQTVHYLINDNVGHDGWGTITIFRNIEWLDDNRSNDIQTRDDVLVW